MRTMRYRWALRDARKPPKVLGPDDTTFDSTGDDDVRTWDGALPHGVWRGLAVPGVDPSGLTGAPISDVMPGLDLPGVPHRVAGHQAMLVGPMNVRKWQIAGTLGGESFSSQVFTGSARQDTAATQGNTAFDGTALTGGLWDLIRGEPLTGGVKARRTRYQYFTATSGGVRSALDIWVFHGGAFYRGGIWSPAISVQVEKSASSGGGRSQTRLRSNAVEPSGGSGASVTFLGKSVVWEEEELSGGASPPAAPGPPSCSIAITAVEWW